MTKSLFPPLLRRWCLLHRSLLLRLRLHLFLLLLLLQVTVPRPSIAQATPAIALTRPSKLLRQVLRRDLREELVLICGANDVDLVHRHLVQPDLDDGPHGAERPRRVDNVELAHYLRIAVLPDRRSLHDVVLDAVEVGERDALQVQDRAERLDWVPDLARGSGHARGQRALVLADQSLQQSLLRRGGVERFDVQLAKTLNVDRATILKTAPNEFSFSLPRKEQNERGRPKEKKKVHSYLVNLVVILRVILVHLYLLRKFKRPVTKKGGIGFSQRPKASSNTTRHDLRREKKKMNNAPRDLIDLLIFPPLFRIQEHRLGLGYVKFARA